MKNENQKSKSEKNYEQIIRAGDNWPPELPDYILKAIAGANLSLPDLEKCTNAELDILIIVYQGIVEKIRKFKES